MDRGRAAGTAKDTTALAAAIVALGNTSLDQDKALDDRGSLAQERIIAANAL